MRNINDYLPKLPKNSLGIATNFSPSDAERQQLFKAFPFDSRWHEFFIDGKQIHVDGMTILKQNAKRFT